MNRYHCHPRLLETNFMNPLLTLSAVFGLLAVLIGAFGAHGIENSLPEQLIARYQTGVEYHFYHSLALFGVAILASKSRFISSWLWISAIAFSVGIVLFSGSLYLYAITGIYQFGMVTPLGGLAFIVGWGALMIFSLRHH